MVKDLSPCNNGCATVSTLCPGRLSPMRPIHIAHVFGAALLLALPFTVRAQLIRGGGTTTSLVDLRADADKTILDATTLNRAMAY
jgi:hypothetical protein